MKKNITSAIRLTVATLILFAIIYPACVWGIAQMASNKGKGDIIEYAGNRYYSNIGQSFTEDNYFWSRPSAVGYKAAVSGGSNKAPSDRGYLQTVQARIDIFLLHNTDIQKNDIPVDLITASGSGLDPDISVQAAKVQVRRIAKVRGLAESVVQKLVDAETQQPLFGIFGPQKVNVLKLNIALDKLK